MKFEEIYAHMAEEYKTLAGVEPEDAADVSIRLKVLAGELYTVLCAAESLKLNCFPQTAAACSAAGFICWMQRTSTPKSAGLCARTR